MAELTSDHEVDDVFSSATEIIELAGQVVADERWELQYMPFSIFLSGVVSRKKDEKALALKLMTALERESFGGNTATMRRLLETIYEKQHATTGNGEHDLAVDWVEVMRMSGLRLVMFGM
jgi:Fungal specific transcription factor domain